jgi:hypothetical protein
MMNGQTALDLKEVYILRFKKRRCSVHGLTHNPTGVPALNPPGI